MSKGTGKKDQLVKVVAPQHVSSADPMVISFARWKADDLPKVVTVEVIEVDSTSSDDNLATAEDMVVRYSGTLTPAADESAQLEDIKILDVTSVARGPDRIWVRFANQKPGDVVEAGIPFSPAIAASNTAKSKKGKKDGGKPAEFAANEGSFYELAVRVREGEGESGAELAMSEATAVRQRAFVLLAVEPLSQNDSSMTHDTGVRILETYHPKDKKKHQPRNWGSTVIRLRNHQPMELGSSGCSYVIVTMLLRYLRVDATAATPDEGAEELRPADPVANQTARLFDVHIKFGDLSTKPQFKPRIMTKPLNPEIKETLAISEARYASERSAFVEHFMDQAKANKVSGTALTKHQEKLVKFFNAKTKGKDGFMHDGPPLEKNIDESPYYKDPVLTAESYVPLLVWRINELDERAEDYKLQRFRLNQPQLSLSGPSDYRTLEHNNHTEWQPQYQQIPLTKGSARPEKLEHMVAGERGKSVTNDDGILIPLATALTKLFQLTNTAPHKDVQEYDTNEPGDPELLPWQRFFVRTLDRGLPIVGLFSPGQYSTREDGGHFCMIVGYRYRTDLGDGSKKKIRFIINDPAGGLTFQYEAHDEEELNPDGIDPTKPLDAKKKGLGLKRERRGLNLIIERRKLLSIREIRVYEPPAWDPARHARFLFFRGRVEDDVGA